MPIQIGENTYDTFDAAVAACKKEHPTWSDERCRAYVAAIEKKGEGGFPPPTPEA